MDTYSVEEDDGQGLMVCAVLNGSTDVYPLVGFMTTTTANDSGENMKTYIKGNVKMFYGTCSDARRGFHVSLG